MMMTHGLLLEANLMNNVVCSRDRVGYWGDVMSKIKAKRMITKIMLAKNAVFAHLHSLKKLSLHHENRKFRKTHSRIGRDNIYMLLL